MSERDWKKEAQRVESEINEFGRPITPDHDYHEIRDWMVWAFNEGLTKSEGDASEEGERARYGSAEAQRLAREFSKEHSYVGLSEDGLYAVAVLIDAAHRRGWDEALAAIADAAHQIRDGGLIERFIRALPYRESK